MNKKFMIESKKMTLKKKRGLQKPQRALQNTKSSLQNTSSARFCKQNNNAAQKDAPENSLPATIPDLVAAIIEIGEAIARLQESAECKDQSAECQAQNEKHSELRYCAGGNSSLNSELEKADPPAPNSTATFLQTWLHEQQIMFENFTELVPQLETTELNTAARLRLNGSGVRRYGFIEKVFEVSADFPQFWPPFGDGCSCPSPVLPS